ncbi:MAG: ATP-dependent Clp protease proteolytic subunit [Patescibacteria group bacterium]
MEKDTETEIGGDAGARAVTSEALPLCFYGEVTGASVMRLQYELMARLAKQPGARLPLFMASPGGSMIPAIAFWEFVTLQKIELDITTLAVGSSASMVILAAGIHRRASSTSRFLLHPTSLGLHGRSYLNDLKRDVRFGEIDEERYLKILAVTTGHSLEKIRELAHAHTYLTAQEAKELGLIHEVLEIMG